MLSKNVKLDPKIDKIDKNYFIYFTLKVFSPVSVFQP